MESLDGVKEHGGDVTVANPLENTNGDHTQNGRSVLFVTPSDCTNETNDAAKVEHGTEEQSESGSVPIVEAVTSRLQQHIQRLWVTADTSFGGNQGEGSQNEKNDACSNAS